MIAAGNTNARSHPSCTGAKRVRVPGLYLALCLILGAALACIPLDIRTCKLDMSSPHNNLICADIRQNAAYAADWDVAPYVNPLLTHYAEEAGLTDSEFVATVMTALTTSTGANILNGSRDVGYGLADTLANNLDSLVDAADYPAWDTLSDTDKSNWGDKETYDTAKFNSLLDAFGFGQTTEDFYSSGGGTFEPETGIQRKLEQLGNIGRNWINGAGNNFSDLKSLLDGNSTTVINNWLGVDAFFHATPNNIDGWPSAFPLAGVYYDLTNIYRAIAYVNNREMVWQVNGNSAVYMAPFGLTGDGNRVVVMFSKETFRWSTGTSNPTINALQRTHDLGIYYYAVSSTASSNPYTVDTITLNNPISEDDRTVFVREIVPRILYGNVSRDSYGKIQDYPDTEPSGDTVIYAPTYITNNNNTWNSYTTKPVQPRPENPYNPGNQTGGDDWRDETSQNVMPLMGIHFDKLFPFSLVYDLPKLSDKVTELTIGQSSSGVYNKVSIPFNPGFMEEEVELDLAPVHDLLVMVQPFVFVLVLVGMVMSLVLFWKSILTGD